MFSRAVFVGLWASAWRVLRGIRAAKTSVYAARWLEKLGVRSRVLIVPDAGISGYFPSRWHSPRWML